MFTKSQASTVRMFCHGRRMSARFLFGASDVYLNSQRLCVPRALRHVHTSCACPSKKTNRIFMRMEKSGVGPDGKPLPMSNMKRIFPKMYKVLMVNQDGSTYTVNHWYPFRIVTLPLDLSTLTAEELAQKPRTKVALQARVYVEEEGLDEDEEWSQDKYRDLL